MHPSRLMFFSQPSIRQQPFTTGQQHHSPFNALKRNRALLLSALLGASTSSHSADIEEVIVSASPINNSQADTLRALAVLSGDKLRDRAASSLGETLNGLVGVSSSSFGPGVGLPVIRGQTDNRVKIMQDSISTMDAAAASPDHAITLEPLLAQRIEVLRGPAALRYGSGAIGGVVNVIDNRITDTRPDAPSGGLEIRHTPANSENVAIAKVTAATGNLVWYADGLTRSSDNQEIPGAAANNVDDPDETTHGYIANTDADAHSGNLGVTYVGERGFIGLAVNKLNNQYGIPPGAHEHHDELETELEAEHDEEPEYVRIHMQQTRIDLKGELYNPFSGFETLRLRLGHNDYEHQEIESGNPGTRFTNNAWEGRLESVHNPIGLWRGALGLQLSDRDFAAIGSEAFIPPSRIRQQGLFLVEEAQWQAWLFEFGGRAEWQQLTPKNTATITHTTINVSSAARWQFTEHQHLNINLAQSQRAPSIEELMASGAHPATNSYLQGDASLRKETSNNLELGYTWENERVSAAINAYLNKVDNFIFAEASGLQREALDEYYYRQRNATFKGIEAETTIAASEALNIRLYADKVTARLNNGANVPRLPPAHLGTEFTFEHNNWRSRLDLRHGFAQNNPGPNETPTASYTQLDLNLSYTFAQTDWESVVFVNASNVLDRDIRNATSYLRQLAPEAGRTISAGIRLTF